MPKVPKVHIEVERYSVGVSGEQKLIAKYTDDVEVRQLGQGGRWPQNTYALKHGYGKLSKASETTYVEMYGANSTFNFIGATTFNGFVEIVGSVGIPTGKYRLEEWRLKIKELCG